MTSFGSRVFALCPASVDFSSFTEMCQAGRAVPFCYGVATDLLALAGQRCIFLSGSDTISSKLGVPELLRLRLHP